MNTDNFFDVRRDIEAAVATAKALGYGSIVLQGHSLGTVQIAFYASTDWDPAIKAVILTGAFEKLPWKSRHILIQDEISYKALADASLAALRADKAAKILPIAMRWLGGVETPMTAQHFLTYRDEQTSAADGTYWISRIAEIDRRAVHTQKVLRCRFGRFGLRHHLLAMRPDQASEVGQMRQVVLAPQQKSTELLLELVHGAGQRRLGDAAALCRAREVQGLAERQEVAHLMDFHTGRSSMIGGQRDNRRVSG